MTVEREPWHLDRRVPIATLVVLVVQFALGVMWITTLSNRVETFPNTDYIRVAITGDIA